MSISFKKIKLIIAREYTTRVRKKSFIIMTILGPLLFAGLMIVPTYLTTVQDNEVKRFAVIDSSHLFAGKIANTELMKFEFKENVSIANMKKNYKKEGYFAVLYIPHIILTNPNTAELFSDKQPAWSIKEHISNSISKELEMQKMLSYNIDNLQTILQSVKTKVDVRCIELGDSGAEKERNTTLAMIVGYVAGFLIYFFIFLFGSQVMRGVIEEKTSRIIEVIVSSVKPFELMMGKIVGIAFVGLTQFVVWVVLTFGIITVSQKMFFPEMSKTTTEQVISSDLMKSNVASTSKQTTSYTAAKEEINSGEKQEETSKVQAVFESLKNLNLPVLLGSFLFFFIGGYLLYASMFAAIGSAVDNETDTQQFMLPVTILLILAIILMPNVIQNPDGALAYWASIIPFTSPVIMMVRIPFGVPWWTVAISAGVLVLSFIFTTWMAGKIYRTGILMYGKKSNYREIWKWLKYKS